MKYMLMFWEDESAQVTPEEGAATLTAIRSWVDEMTGRGIRLHGSELEPVSQARFVSVRDGEMLVSDGPYAETKEQIGGYDVIECASLGAAMEVAAAHPIARTGTVEVRPLGDFPGDQ
jgi:hypothetical protein